MEPQRPRAATNVWDRELKKDVEGLPRGEGGGRETASHSSVSICHPSPCLP